MEMNDRLRELRYELRLNQAEFSKKIGIAQSTYAALESGKAKIKDRHIKLICSTFNINSEWLIKGTGNIFGDDLTEKVGIEIARMFSKSDELTKKIMLGLSELNEEEIEIVKILVDGLVNKKKQFD